MDESPDLAMFICDSVHKADPACSALRHARKYSNQPAAAAMVLRTSGTRRSTTTELRRREAAGALGRDYGYDPDHKRYEDSATKRS